MQNHFKFGHTIQPIKIQDESQSNQDLEDLFKIGAQKIEIQRNQEESVQQIDSDQTPTIKPEKHKHLKKQSKEKKQKKEKREKKDKRHKKEKKKRGRDSRSSQRLAEKQRIRKEILISSQSQNERVLAIYVEKKAEMNPKLVERYNRQLKSKCIYLLKIVESQDLGHTFEWNKKLGQGYLNIDIVNFPQPEIYKYGHMDKDIPQYNRLPHYDQIIGGPKTGQKDLSRQINKKLNQKVFNQHGDDISRSRYFNFQGYKDMNSQKLPYVGQSMKEVPVIHLGVSQTFAQSQQQEKWLKKSRQYNSKLNENPNDIKLWLELIQMQDKMTGLARNSKNKSAIMQRQISILEKALKANPLNEQLGLSYLAKMAQKQTERSVIAAKCLEFIKAHPESVALWRIYLQFRVNQFNLYSHEWARKVFEEVTGLYRSMIDSTRSAVQVWNIRKAGLGLIKQMALLYKLEGYGELATGLLVALIDFNFFMPPSIVQMTTHQARAKEFGEHWQNQTTYKLGQVLDYSGWGQHQQTQKQTDSFIGRLQGHISSSTVASFVMRQLELHRQVWRPSHPLQDQALLRERPESYVLIEDIDFSLHLYRDPDSYMTLLDLLADHLQLPLVSTSKGYHSQFSYKQVHSALSCLIDGKKKKTSFLDQQFYWWQRYWNPFKCSLTKDRHQLQKLEYFRRILEATRATLNIQKQAVVLQYLVFITCCYYYDQDIRAVLNLDENQVLTMMTKLLSDSAANIAAWTMYFQTTYELKQNLQECIGCYLQLLQSHQNAPSQDYKKDVIYWLTNFASRHHPESVGKVLNLYLNMLDGRVQIGLENELTKEAQNRLGRYLQQQLDTLQHYKTTNFKGRNAFLELQLPLLVLSCMRQGFFSDLQNYQKTIVSFLVEYISTSKDPLAQEFVLSELLPHRLLSLTDIRQNNIMTKLSSVALVEYWVQLNQSPFLVFLAQFELMQGSDLPLWMVTSIFLWQQTNYKSGFQDYLFKVGKKLCFDGQLEIHPLYVIMLNQLLLLDVQSTHYEFLQYSLKQLPYAKQLYLFNLIRAPTKVEADKFLTLMQNKSIRAVQQELYQ